MKRKTDKCRLSPPVHIKTELSKLTSSSERAQFLKVEAMRTALQLLAAHKVPLVVVCIFVLFFPRLIPLWLAVILFLYGGEAIYNKLPSKGQRAVRRMIPLGLRKAEWVSELRDGLRQIRPFILGAIFLVFLPVTICAMLIHWITKASKHGKREVATNRYTPDSIAFVQNRAKENVELESSFIYSPAFSVTILTLFVLGVPAAVSWQMYHLLGVDAVLGFPSHNPKFYMVFGIIGLYLMSIAWCIGTLFLRAWFTFPLNFASLEYELELNAREIRRHEYKGWFTTIYTLNAPFRGTSVLKWNQVRKVSYSAGGRMKLYPLPSAGFSQGSVIYEAFNKLAALFDGMVDKLGRTDYIAFIEDPDSECSGCVYVNLWELDAEERARLYYAVRKWAPHAIVDDEAQEKLLGSVVMKDVRYTQIWFDILTAHDDRKRISSLQSHDKLQNGKLTIVERIASGGQSNTYLSKTAAGELVVLKEFVLSPASARGAQVESAADFENECTVLSQLSHAKIVKLLGLFAEDGRAYLMLEHVSGSSLRQVVKEQGPLAEKHTVELALQLCEVMEYLHRQNPPVVHRDLSPDNIMLQPDGLIKLIDFSLASRSDLRSSGECVGKHAYTPPEQFREEACSQSDIYAFGATLYYLLTGTDPRPISQSSPKVKVPAISEKLNALVERATSLDLNERYDYVCWITLELEALMNGFSRDNS